MNPTDRIHETNGHIHRLPHKDADPVEATLSSLLRLLALGQPVSFDITLGGWRGRMEVQPVAEPAPVASLSVDGPPLHPDMTPTESAIVEVLRQADKPIKITTIALRAKIACNSYLRECSTNLQRKKIVRRVEGFRYWLVSRPLPAAEGQP